MLREATASVNFDVKDAVVQLLKEDARFDELERRSLHRETLVRPVTVSDVDGADVVGGVCRNISQMGMCLLTRKSLIEQKVARISIHRLEAGPAIFLAECRWSSPFGCGWFMSGWSFINLVQRR